MADKGMFTAVSGAMAQNAKLETISNNIANANTNAFKRDQQVFKEYLTSYEKAPDVIQVPRIPASIESFYDHNGGDKSFVDVQGTYSDFTQGSMKSTGNLLDLALEGRGFFEVLTPNGVEYTRNGSFIKDNQGRLVTKEGLPVLSSGTEEPLSRVITLAEGSVSVGDRGQISINGQAAKSLSVVEFETPDTIRKVGSGRFSLNEGAALPVASQQTQVQQGFLEGSNVNIIREMTDMIATTRLFESTQKAIQAYDSMNGKAINEIPKF